MANKIIFMLLAGVAVFGWFYVGLSDYYAINGSISPGYMLVTALTVALMRS